MNAEKAIKNEARKLLSEGNWSKAVAVFFILFASVILVLFVQSVLVLAVDAVLSPLFNNLAEFNNAFSTETDYSLGNSIITTISSGGALISYALGFLFLFPLYCGVKRFFYKISKGEEPGIDEVFHYIAKDLKKGLALGGRYGIFCVLKLLPCMAIPYILVAVIISAELSTVAESFLILAVFATGFAGFWLWTLWTSKQFLSIYLFIENDSLPAGKYAKISVQMLNGNLNNSVRKLVFSFGGWLLFALTGVGMIYFIPYFETALATSAKWMIKLDSESTDAEPVDAQVDSY